MTLAGGKGINIARALKRLGVPVVATGLAGGGNGTRIVEDLTAEAILNDFVRIEDDSRTSTAIVDPAGAPPPRSTSGARAFSRTSWRCSLEKLIYLSRGADYVIFAGSLPRGIEDGFYAEAIRELNRRGVLTVLDSAGEALRLGAQAEPLPRLAERARGRSARRPGVPRRRRLPRRARGDRGGRRAQRADHARVRLLGAAPRRARAAPLPRAGAAHRPGLGGRLGRRPARRLHRGAPRAALRRGGAPVRRRGRRGVHARARRGPVRGARGGPIVVVVGVEVAQLEPVAES